MNPYILTFLVFNLGLGTTMTFASSHWLLAWMGLEINTLAIIPIMTQQHHPRAVEATTKYFLTQATAAAMILFASTSNAWLTGEWDINQMSNPVTSSMILLALSLKLGLAPVHYWMPEVIQGLDLATGLILSTWQKLAPFILLLQVAPTLEPSLLVIIGVLSTLMGGWGGLNQTQLRKILAYSSIAHLGWMVIIIQFSPPLALLTLLIYIVMTSSAFLTFKFISSTTINALATSWTKSPMIISLSTLILLSLAGLPPLTGFMPKWLILQELLKQDLPLLAFFAAMTALLSLYFYLRLCYSVALTSSPNTITASAPWRLNPHQTSFFTPLAMMLTLTLLPITPSMLTMVMP
uniref:NADH-ubiquinone oxidoreductase chain 2 n=3 Tax=Esox TaxID=8009 RepID=T2HNZ7_ESONI|nr:NADH dehydrogenase subunit 2 [Esox niger]QPF96592.1 NADH dehydrogenase subunit 2 [Esox americanus vermiculatus]QPF96683.1 NADH dehydrogenase subunit 2 [Esox niger]QPF96787.1 NADH dehydrogenase subunit 2 [Esox americanus americanus]BAN81584.1 NADH dehydrogenase subunit 2 [Esox niger]